MKKKKDIADILSKFTWIASYDQELQKHYIVFSDRKRGGIYTLMLKQKQWSVHGYGFGYCDNGETFMTEKEMVDFLWKHRAAFRRGVLGAEKEQKGMQRVREQ